MKRKIVRLFTIEPFELEGLERSFQILENNFFGRQFVANVFEKSILLMSYDITLIELRNALISTALVERSMSLNIK
jgi:hypothetical protein